MEIGPAFVFTDVATVSDVVFLVNLVSTKRNGIVACTVYLRLESLLLKPILLFFVIFDNIF